MTLYVTLMSYLLYAVLYLQVLGRTWATEAAEYIARLKSTQTMGQPSSSSLLHSDYHLNMILSQSALSKQQEPTAIFEFTLRAPDNTPPQPTVNSAAAESNGVISSASADKLCMEFNHAELFSFFTQLERMQQQLDALGTS